MLAMPSTSAPASRSTSTTSSTLPPVEIRSSTTTTFWPGSSLPSIWFLRPWSFAAGADVAHGQVQQVGGDGRVGDAGGAGAHQDLRLRDSARVTMSARPFSTSSADLAGAVRVRRLSQ